MNKKRENKKKTRHGRGFLWFIGISALSVALLIVCQFYFENMLTGDEKFFENTRINGLDVGGMSLGEAENVVLTDMLNNKKDIEIELTAGDKKWTLSGDDFELHNKIEPEIRQISRAEHGGNLIENLKREKRIKQEGRDFQVSYTSVLANLNEKIDEIVSEIERPSRAASLIFMPNETDVFQVDEGQSTIVVDRGKLYQEIDHALSISKKAKVEIPTIEIEQNIDIEAIKNSVGKRSSFTTSYVKSSKERKNNIKRALESFNGLIINPGQTVSFNQVTGPRTIENGYQNAHIIVGGNYVDGVGGGVCQASTTLYNALLLADIDVLSVNHHTLPASYVPLSFDAMVSGDYSDLVFQNNLDSPVYIKTIASDSEVTVEIYGQKLEEGQEIKHVSELVKILPHNGDRVVSDTKGAYADKILYKGEFLRLKYPREGYESKAFLRYYKNGELEKEKEIRHDFYPAQEGVVMEGVEDAAEGMIIPASEVKIIKPQKVSKETEQNIKNKLSKTNPSEYNP